MIWEASHQVALRNKNSMVDLLRWFRKKTETELYRRTRVANTCNGCCWYFCSDTSLMHLSLAQDFWIKISGILSSKWKYKNSISSINQTDTLFKINKIRKIQNFRQKDESHDKPVERNRANRRYDMMMGLWLLRYFDWFTIDFDHSNRNRWEPFITIFLWTGKAGP